MPTPLGSSGNSAPRPTSTIVKSATTLGCPSVITGHVVPGLAGASGKRLFPEGTASNYRIVEIRLPSLKHSVEQTSKTPHSSVASGAATKSAAADKPVMMAASAANGHEAVGAVAVSDMSF
ncbi:hypothetical protein LPJ56_006883 [Coemansia sp. RSA 2599]|nr:hypothetical protein LPJ56_006883 [Coemansia sp. RSA 2599]